MNNVPPIATPMTTAGVRLRLRLAMVATGSAYLLGVHTPPASGWSWVLFIAGFVGAEAVTWRAFVDTSAADAPQSDPSPIQASGTQPDAPASPVEEEGQTNAN